MTTAKTTIGAKTTFAPSREDRAQHRETWQALLDQDEVLRDMVEFVLKDHLSTETAKMSGLDIEDGAPKASWEQMQEARGWR